MHRTLRFEMQIALFPYVRVMAHYAHVAATKESAYSFCVAVGPTAHQHIHTHTHTKEYMYM